MLKSRNIVRTARAITVWLIVVLVCPPSAEIVALASSGSVACTALHACCRRAANDGACPHQMPAADQRMKCHGAVCVLTCGDTHDQPIAPVAVIGCFPASTIVRTQVVSARVAAASIGSVRSLRPLPVTPPPRPRLA